MAYYNYLLLLVPLMSSSTQSTPCCFFALDVVCILFAGSLFFLCLCTCMCHMFCQLHTMHDMQEPNFHVLYLELMEQMNKPMMDRHLASTTFKYIKILLRSDRIKTQVPRPSAPLRFPAHSVPWVIALSCMSHYTPLNPYIPWLLWLI